jgi:tetratricopeptide (TPR) repeat protein
MHFIKSLSLILSITFCAFQLTAQDLPTPSPLGKVEQRVGLTDVAIEYSRPGVKGRTIFGDLLPYDSLWRTGANAATKISFSTDVKIEGKEVKAGEYAMFSIPSKDKWIIAFNKDTKQGGTGNYKKELDVLRITVTPVTTPLRETLTFTIDNVSDGSADVTLNWEKTAVSFKVTMDFMTAAEKNIEDELKRLDNLYNSYNKIARYYIDNNMKLDEALKLSKKSVDMSARFWNVYTLSLAHAANKQYKEAIAAAEKSKALAMHAKYEEYVNRNATNIEAWKKMK